MTEPPFELEDGNENSETWWRKLMKPYLKSFKNECNVASLELGVESYVATYIITRFVLKRPQSAFKYSAVAFMTLPIINWPLCVIMKNKALTTKNL